MAAISPVSRVVNKKREKITALPLYYFGYLQKKYTGEKHYKRYFGELRGSTIFLYTNDMHDKYSERVELQNMVSIDTTKTKSGLTIFTLTLQHGKIHLKFDNADMAEVWRGFIMTVAKLEIPHWLQLLPGQRLRLEEVLEKEHQRTALPLQPITSDPSCRRPCPLPPSLVISTETYDNAAVTVPPCFFSVTRQEAEEMLAQHPQKGNIILRPAKDSVNYAITVRIVMNSGPAMKHYKVRSGKSGFLIELDEPVTVPSLSDVVNHFVKTLHCLRPYAQTADYDTCIEMPPILSVSPLRPPLARVAPRIHAGLAPPTTISHPLHQKPLEETNVYHDPDLIEQDSEALNEKLPQTGQRRGRHQHLP